MPIFVRLRGVSLQRLIFFILYGERFEDAVKGGSMGPFVGIVADNDTRHAAGVCVHKANGEAILN